MPLKTEAIIHSAINGKSDAPSCSDKKPTDASNRTYAASAVMTRTRYDFSGINVYDMAANAILMVLIPTVTRPMENPTLVALSPPMFNQTKSSKTIAFINTVASHTRRCQNGVSEIDFICYASPF